MKRCDNFFQFFLLISLSLLVLIFKDFDKNDEIFRISIVCTHPLYKYMPATFITSHHLIEHDKAILIHPAVFLGRANQMLLSLQFPNMPSSQLNADPVMNLTILSFALRLYKKSSHTLIALPPKIGTSAVSVITPDALHVLIKLLLPILKVLITGD